MNSKTNSLLLRIIISLLIIVIYNFLLPLIPLPGLEGEMLSVYNNGDFPRLFSVRSLGIMPLLNACFLLTLIYYIIIWIRKNENEETCKPRITMKTVLIVTGILTCFQGVFLIRAIGKFNPSGIYIKAIWFVIVAASVFAGVLCVYLITRLGVVDGLWGLMILHPGIFEFFRDSGVRWFGQPEDPNARLGRIVTFAFIFIALIMALKKLPLRRFFHYRIPLHKERKFHFPIYLGGLFFFSMGMRAFSYLFFLPFILHLEIPFINQILVEFGNFINITSVIVGFVLYSVLSRWIFNFQNLSLKEPPEKIHRFTYWKYGVIQLAILLIFHSIMLTVPVFKDTPVIMSSSRLVTGIMGGNFLLLFLLFLLEFPKRCRIITENYTPVFNAMEIQKVVKTSISLEREGIETNIIQPIYNCYAGFMVEPFGQKKIFVKPEDAEKAGRLITETFETAEMTKSSPGTDSRS